MASISFTGNVARPEMKELGGKDVCTFAVAEGHRRKDRQSGRYEDSGTTWHRVTYWGNTMLTPRALFDAINHKGAMVLVTGRQETRSYTKDGEERSITEVTADYAAPLQKDGQGGRSGPNSGGFGSPSGGGFGAPQQGAGGFGGSGGFGSTDGDFGGGSDGDFEPPF